MLIDIQSIRQAAKNKAATTGDVATLATTATNQPQNRDFVATVAAVATSPRVEAASLLPAPAQSVATVATVAAVATSPVVQPAPSMAPLLALADSYCTAIGASDKVRNDWRSDIEATAPNDRQGLAAYLRGELAKLVPVVPAMPPKAVPTVPASTTWREADKADQIHYWGCPRCLAVVKAGTGSRCATGQQLHDTYIEVATRERFIGAQPDPAKPLPKLHSAQSWRAADSAWLAHWGQCPTCKAAGRTNTARCTQGEALFTTYQQAAEAGINPHD